MFGIFDAAGRVLSLYTGSLPDAQMLAEGGAGWAEWPGGEIGDWWRDGGAWALRPALPDLPAMSAGVEAVVAGYPEGAAVAIHSGITGQQAGAVEIGADGELRLTLAAGPWRVVVNPPFPHLAQDVAVEVSE